MMPDHVKFPLCSKAKLKSASFLLEVSFSYGQKKYMCVYGHPTDPIFQPPTLTFLIGNYSTLIFASNPINFYTEFG
jgi:hypothetical protein